MELLNNEIVVKILSSLEIKKYFLAFRTSPERMTIYYKGLIVCELIYNHHLKKTFILPRKFSNSKNNSIVKINQIYQNELAKYYSNGKFENIVLDNLQIFNEILIAGEKFLDSFFDTHYKNRIKEKIIQQEIACQYQYNEDFMCVDLEYNQCFNNMAEKNSNETIKGRYDFIILKKMVANVYKIIFVELKSNINACTDYFTGLINHKYDSIGFLDAYNNTLNNEIKRTIDSGILFTVKQKLNKDIILDDTPEFAFLFNMVPEEKNKTPKTYNDIFKLIDKEIVKAKNTKSVDSINKINNDKIIDNTYSKRDIDNNLKEKIYKQFSQTKCYYDDFVEIKYE
jgi:hypothetical protein